MNRWDEIKATARNIATNVHTDPTARDAMADELIKLCGLMIDAAGKGVAISGEGYMNTEDDEDGAYYAMYRTGESMQRAAQTAMTESVDADLERYSRPSPGDRCHCGHVKLVHHKRGCTGESYNGEPCKDGPCTGFVAKPGNPVWVHVDRRPQSSARPCCYDSSVTDCSHLGVAQCCVPTDEVCPSHH